MLTGLGGAWRSGPSTWDEFLTRYGRYPLVLTEWRPGVPLSRALSELHEGLAAHLKSLIAHNPSFTYYAMALPVRPPVAEELSVPEPVARRCWRSMRPLLYAGSRGAQSYLHLDSDYSHGLHLVVVGEKRVFFFPPEATAHLRPEFNLGGPPFHEWSLEEKRRLVAEAGGSERVVRAGEAFFIPKNWWHHVEYLDHSVGLSWRFERSPAQNLLTLLVKQPIHEIVQLSQTLEADGPDTTAWARSLLEAVSAGGEDPAAHARLVDFLERSYEARVAPERRYRSSLGEEHGFDVLRRRAPSKHRRPIFRFHHTAAFQFLDPARPIEDLRAIVAGAVAVEVRDLEAARAAFARSGWPWPEDGSSAEALRLSIAGLRDHTRFFVS